MSDLQCPATVIVVRHGQSEGNLVRRLSSVPPGSALSALGRQQAREVGEALRDRRIARVYTSPLLRARQTAAEIAGVVGADVEVLDGVRELGLGAFEGSVSPEHWADVDAVFAQWLEGDLTLGVGGDETGERVAARVGEALDWVVDAHRGETVVVVSHAGVMGLVLPRLAGLRAESVRGRPVPNCGMVELARDGDGWQLVHWPEPTGPSHGELLDVIGRAEAARHRVGGKHADVGPAVCSHLPVPFEWATSAVFTASDEPPTPQQVQDAEGWCEETAPGSWRVTVRGEHAAVVLAQAQGRLRVDQALEVLATTAIRDAPRVPGLQVVAAVDAAEFVGVYGQELAPLVEGQLETPGLHFLVARLGGETVGCARAWDLAGTGYVSAVSVRPDARGRGIGRALSAVATGLALRRHPVAWLHCEQGVEPLYLSLGFQPVTTHVHLVRASAAPG